MSEDELVTDTDLARARLDPAFRHQLLVDNLERLLGELKKLRRTEPGPAHQRQVREGAELALKLADLLHRLGHDASHAA